MGRGSRSACWLAWFGLLAACGGGTTSAELRPGRIDGNPDPSALPSLPRAGADSDARTRRGLLVVREAFAHPLPEPPVDRSHARLERWVEHDVVEWLDGRRERLEQARFEFGVGRGAGATERVVAQAASGLLQEDTARQLAKIPAPLELDSEPEVREIYREVIRAQARPFLSSALVGYRECADLGHGGPDGLEYWVSFCDGRFQRLKVEVDADQRSIVHGEAPAADAPPASGETHTTVIVEQP